MNAILLSTLLTVLPGQWDGVCIPIPPPDAYTKHNPGVWKGRGYIPPDKRPDDSDIKTCIPPAANGMGPK